MGTGDVHYLRAEDADPHEVLLCVQTGDELANPRRFRFPNKEFYFKTPDEMARVFAPYGRDLLRPTLEIAERCNVTLELDGIRLPRFDVPEGEDALAYLTRLCEQGLARRYETVSDDLRARLAFELRTIQEMGFADYFLIVWDFVAFAKREGVGVGPGRGSAAGSLVAYCLGITDVDPIRYDLLFERFLNPGRKSMPDIDIDFSVHGRERVMEYVVAKYGRERVAQIITFGKLAAKAATRDVGRVLGLPFATVDRIAKFIPEGVKVGFDECMKPGQELRAAYDDPQAIGRTADGTDITARDLIDMARPLEGLIRQDGIHAAAVVIGDRPLVEYLPLQRKGVDKELVTQYAMGDVERLGLLKMDFLGLRNLDVIDEAVRLIEESSGQRLDMEGLPLDDGPTFAMLQRGDATGVFQFESSGMRDALRQVRPTEFDDLIALVALYRPGPMANIPVYARRKNGEEAISYTDPRLEPILGSTQGVYIYQEQAMQIAKELAGFSPAQADDLRKAIGKKDAKLMASLKDEFLAGSVQNGVERKVAEHLWQENERSADYSFNKAHAACYALIAYRTAYLKANHPAEYMAALISSVMDTKDRVPFYAQECADMGIDVLPPDVNASERDFAVREGKIRFGLSAVKNVGDNAVRAIVLARGEGGEFRLHLGLLRARGLAARDRARAGEPGQGRRARLHGRPPQGHAARARPGRRRGTQGAGRPQRRPGQPVRGALGGGDDAAARPHSPVPAGEMDRRELLAFERETLGLYLSSHPLADVRQKLRRRVDCELAGLAARRDGETVTIGGLIGGIRQLTTKRGDPMAFVQLEDQTGGCEVVVFSTAYQTARATLEVDRVVLVKGRVDLKTDQAKLVAFEVQSFDEVPDIGIVRVAIDARTVPGLGARRPPPARARLPGRDARGRRPRHLARRAPAAPRLGVPRARRAPVLRRGARARRRGDAGLAPSPASGCCDGVAVRRGRSHSRPSAWVLTGGSSVPVVRAGRPRQHDVAVAVAGAARRGPHAERAPRPLQGAHVRTRWPAGRSARRRAAHGPARRT